MLTGDRDIAVQIYAPTTRVNEVTYLQVGDSVSALTLFQNLTPTQATQIINGLQQWCLCVV